MPNVYGQNTKITDVVGRSATYLVNRISRKKLSYTKKNMVYDWSFFILLMERKNAHQENQRHRTRRGK